LNATTQRFFLLTTAKQKQIGTATINKLTRADEQL